MKQKRIVALSSRLTEKANQLIVSELKKYNLPTIAPSHGDILHLLFSQESYEMGELAKKIHRTKPTITVLVDKLVKNGYVQKVKSDKDARYTSVIITEKGLELEPIFEKISKKMNSILCKNIDDEEANLLEHLLEIAIKNFEN